MKTVDMKFFDGKIFSFTGVGFSLAADIDESLDDTYQPANAMLIILDGICYTVIEDPDDGYRSSCRNIFVIEDKALVKKLVTNRFRGVKVFAKHISRYDGDHSDIIELTEIGGRTIAVFGTANTHDYYPWFVARFMPGDMLVSRNLK